MDDCDKCNLWENNIVQDILWNNTSLVEINDVLYLNEEMSKKFFNAYKNEFYKCNILYTEGMLLDFINVKRVVEGIPLDRERLKLLISTKQYEKYIIQSFFSMVDLNNVTALKLLDLIWYREDKEIFFKNKIIIEKLKGLLYEQTQDFNIFFKDILFKLGVDNFFNIYTYKDIEEYFFNCECSFILKYRLYIVLFEIDSHATINRLLLDDHFFLDFCDSLKGIYSSIKINYDELVMLIKKIQKLNINKDGIESLVASLTNYQLELLGEDFNIEIIKSIVGQLSIENMNKIFESDILSFALFPYMNRERLLQCKINQKILLRNDLFECIKDISLINMRHNIFILQGNNDTTITELMMEAYEKSIIDSFDISCGLFTQYKKIIEEEVFNLENMDNYLREDASYARYEEKKENYLRKISNIKLSELIIDYLFKDNIYNVWSNIHEILRYEESTKEKILNKRKLEFYKKVLKFDGLSTQEKIDFYNKYKNKNISFMFYNDLRNVKNIAYTNINNKLIDVECAKEYKDKDLSYEYGVEIYDLRKQEYYMLVRYMRADFCELVDIRRNCYTIISSENTTTFLSEPYLYGYNSYDNDTIIHMNELDSYSYDSKPEEMSTDRINRILTPEQLTAVSYSEVQIVNKKYEDYNIYRAKKPDFIIVKNRINDEAVKESKRLGIPIFLIRENLKFYQRSMGDLYNREEYINSYHSERGKKSLRMFSL